MTTKSVEQKTPKSQPDRKRSPTKLPQPYKDGLAREYEDFLVPQKLFQKTTTTYQVAVLAYLNRYAFSSKGVFPGYGDIAKNCHCSPRKAQSTIKELIGLGLIEKIFRGRSKTGEFESNLYYLKPLGGIARGAIPMAQGAIPIAPCATETLITKYNKLNNIDQNKKQETETTPLAPDDTRRRNLQNAALQDRSRFNQQHTPPERVPVASKTPGIKVFCDGDKDIEPIPLPSLPPKKPTTTTKRTTIKNEGLKNHGK